MGRRCCNGNFTFFLEFLTKSRGRKIILSVYELLMWSEQLGPVSDSQKTRCLGWVCGFLSTVAAYKHESVEYSHESDFILLPLPPATSSRAGDRCAKRHGRQTGWSSHECVALSGRLTFAGCTSLLWLPSPSPPPLYRSPIIFLSRFIIHLYPPSLSDFLPFKSILHCT